MVTDFVSQVDICTELTKMFSVIRRRPEPQMSCYPGAFCRNPTEATRAYCLTSCLTQKTTHLLANIVQLTMNLGTLMPNKK